MKNGNIKLRESIGELMHLFLHTHDSK